MPEEKKMITKLVCICCLIAAIPAAWGQAANNQAKPGVLGILDPHTGQFRPVPAPETETDSYAATTFTGTVNLTITITVKSTGLTTFICLMSVGAVDNLTSPVFWDESNTAAATGTGSTRTCKLSIPYSWSLLTQPSDSMTTSYNVFGTGGTTTAPLPARTAGRSPLDSRKVPANGTVTTLTAAVTL